MSVIKKMGVMLNLFQHRKDMATLNADESAPSLVSLVPRQQEELQVQGDKRLEVFMINYGEFINAK